MNAPAVKPPPPVAAKPPARTLPPTPAKPMAATPPPIGAVSNKKFSVQAPVKRLNDRIGIYGTGGIGKTSLACRAPGPVYVIDLDNSLGKLQVDGVQVIGGIDTWTDLRDALHQNDLWKDCKTIVIDTLSRAEEMCAKHVCEHRKTEKGQTVNSIEGYGFGKGYQYLYEEFVLLFADLDAHIRDGRNTICVAHDLSAKVPNPAGDDYKRWEPRLQNPESGKSSVRHKFKDWCDHLLFVGYDVFAKDGKAQGSGTRTIYPQEMPWFMAKSRALKDPMPYPEGDDTVWMLLNQ